MVPDDSDAEPVRAGDVLTALVDEIFRINGALIADGDALTAPFGLTGPRWQVAGFLADAPATVAEIARRRGLARQSVQESVNRLRRDDLVVLTPNPTDRRAPLVCLTARARQALTDLEPLRSRWAEARAADISVADLELTLRTLRRIRGSGSSSTTGDGRG